jgi:hypothetical protein
MVRSLVVLASSPFVGDRRREDAKLSNSSFELDPLVVRCRLPVLRPNGVVGFEAVEKDDSVSTTLLGLAIIPGIAIPPFPKIG